VSFDCAVPTQSRRFRAVISGYFFCTGIGGCPCYCGSDPSLVVLTVESPYFGVSDKTGHISIGEVPAGTYVLHVWYENAPSRTLKTLRRAVVLGDDHRCISTFSLSCRFTCLGIHRSTADHSNDPDGK